MVLEIVKYPDPRLAQKSQKTQINEELNVLVHNMLDTINSFKNPEAAGLSAVQVGMPLRVLIARDVVTATGNAKELPAPAADVVLINPKFVSLSKEQELDWEGCLSFPDLYGKVWRAAKVKLKYQNLAGEEKRLTAGGFLARVIQHEMDHLEGVTFNTKIVGKMYKGAELEAGTRIAD